MFPVKTTNLFCKREGRAALNVAIVIAISIASGDNNPLVLNCLFLINACVWFLVPSFRNAGMCDCFSAGALLSPEESALKTVAGLMN